MSQRFFYTVITGHRSGFFISILRAILFLLSLAYSAIVRCRNFLYRVGLLRIKRVDSTVICVGNLTVGGTGKTPLVIWLCNFLTSRNISTSILTRGYKSTSSHETPLTDEPAILASSCRDTKVVINANRTAGATKAIEQYHSRVLVMDDGFSHLRLARDINIIAIDATNPFGGGHLLPRGLLREPISSIRRAKAVVITRADQVESATIQQIKSTLLNYKADLLIATCCHKPIALVSLSGEEYPLSKLIDKKVLGFCGIGNPDNFKKTLISLGVELTDFLIFNDHHKYSCGDLRDICDCSHKNSTDFILTTEKDFTKITALSVQKHGLNPELANFYQLKIEINFLTGQAKLKRLIETAIASKIN